MSKQTFSVDVTVRAIIDADNQQEAESIIAESLLQHPHVEEYYNLQSREGSHSSLYVGDETDTNVWRPTTTTDKETTMETSYEELKAKTANLYNNYQAALLSSVLKTIDMISNLDEDAGYVILAKLRQHFHMEGNLYGRGDFEAVLGRKLSGQEWEKVYSSQSFYNNLGEDDNLYVYAIQNILEEVGIGG